MRARLFRPAAAVAILGTAGLAPGALTTGAVAADLALKAPPPAPSAWTWDGFYLGVHAGASAGQTQFSDPIGASIFGDKVHTPGFLGGGQIGYNWQLPRSPWVFGVEADVSAMNADGSNTCLATSGNVIPSNCQVHQNATGTVTGRIGYAAGPEGRTLYYLKGGAAWLNESIDMTISHQLPINGALDAATSSTLTKWGSTVGAGIEHALTPAWSVKFEYDYLNFGGSNVAAPDVLTATSTGTVTSHLRGVSTSVSNDAHEAKIGLNYKFGADPWADWNQGPADGAYPVKAAPAPVAQGWEVEGGGRDWYSFGRFQKDLGNGIVPASSNSRLNSRLTYDTTANSGEFYGRVETPWNFFVKGFAGGGGILSGHMNDEDFGIRMGNALVPYSNTVSDPVKGSIAYATIDAGYDIFRAPGQKFGVFVGYNYYQEDKSAFGCTQIANQNSDCVGAMAQPSNVLGITENDRWNSLRVGVNGEIMLWDRLKLSGDAAYIPTLDFSGTDVHLQRDNVPNQTSPEFGNGGSGVQLEAALSYYVTQNLNVGVGARYWAMWSDATTNSFSTGNLQALPVKTERVGAYFQAGYKF